MIFHSLSRPHVVLEMCFCLLHVGSQAIYLGGSIRGLSLTSIFIGLESPLSLERS